MTPDQQKMLDECFDAESGLSPRELEFIGNLEENYRHRELSAKQADWLMAIASRLIA